MIHARSAIGSAGFALALLIVDKMWDEPDANVLRLLLGVAGLGMAYSVWPAMGVVTHFLARWLGDSLVQALRPRVPPRQQPRTKWRGPDWEFVQVGTSKQARPFCPQDGHESHRLMFEGKTSWPSFSTPHIGDNVRLKCTNGLGHYVQLDGKDRLSFAEYTAAANEAANRLNALREPRS